MESRNSTNSKVYHWVHNRDQELGLSHPHDLCGRQSLAHTMDHVMSKLNTLIPYLSNKVTTVKLSALCGNPLDKGQRTVPIKGEAADISGFVDQTAYFFLLMFIF